MEIKISNMSFYRVFEILHALYRKRVIWHIDSVSVQAQHSKAVFFNLFAAAEPYTSVKVTHGTPCIDP